MSHRTPSQGKMPQSRFPSTQLKIDIVPAAGRQNRMI
jgi:hypothetical protein